MVQGLILKALREIESKYSGHIAFAYRDTFPRRWLIAFDDYDIYASDKEYKELCDYYRERAKHKYGAVLIFVFQYPSEQLLESLIEQDLILNIEE